MLTASLGEIQGALLTYTDLEAEQLPPSPENPVEQLLVHVTSDYSLRIFCANDILNAPPDPGNVSSVFYFISRFPLRIEAPFSNEVQRILGLLNPLLPLGTLELHSEDGLFFRYMLLTEEAVLDGLLALDIILALKQLLPFVFDWLIDVLSQNLPISNEAQQKMRQRFRELVNQVPLLESPTALAAQWPRTQANIHWKSALLALSLAVISMISAYAFGPLNGLLIGLSLILTHGSVFYAWHRYRNHQARLREGKRFDRFSWQLLEIEAIKLAYQDESLTRHRQEVVNKLNQLAKEGVTFPADIVRLRFRIRFLKGLQEHLFDRSHLLKQQRQELEDNRILIAKKPQQVNSLKQQLIASELPSEDLLMQNLRVTLDYLEFPVRQVLSPQGVSPILLVQLREHLPPLSLRWMQQWHFGAEQPLYTWMLCADQSLPLTIPAAAWPRVQEVLRLFNRFLPLGTLICDYQRSRIYLRYRFVRLRGDLSTMLVMEIMEVMATFGERLHQRVGECLRQEKRLENILHEAELDFQGLTSEAS